VRIEVVNREGRRMARDFRPGRRFTPGMEIAGPAGTRMIYESITAPPRELPPDQEAAEVGNVDFALVHEFLLDVGVGVSVTLITTWIIAQFHGRGERTR